MPPERAATKSAWTDGFPCNLQRLTDAQTDDGTEISPPDGADYAETARAILRSAGADVSAAAPDGGAPIHLAVDSDDVEVARLLLNNGADIESADQSGATPLSAALSAKLYDMADMLMKAGAILSNGESIARDAARGGDARMLRVALENGVAPDPSSTKPARAAKSPPSCANSASLKSSTPKPKADPPEHTCTTPREAATSPESARSSTTAAPPNPRRTTTEKHR